MAEKTKLDKTEITEKTEQAKPEVSETKAENSETKTEKAEKKLEEKVEKSEKEEPTEIEKMKHSVDYCHRYFEFDEAIEINQQNREYLKKYIHDDTWVEQEFDLNSKIMSHKKNFIIVAIVAFLLFTMIIFAVSASVVIGFIVGAVAGAVSLFVAYLLVSRAEKGNLDDAKRHQREVNDGIKEQMEALSERERLLISQKNNYYKALQERKDFYIPIEHIERADDILKFMIDGDAETCDDAVGILEQKLLMKELNSITGARITKKTINEREMFGDPLEKINHAPKKKGLMSKLSNK